MRLLQSVTKELDNGHLEETITPFEAPPGTWLHKIFSKPGVRRYSPSGFPNIVFMREDEQ